MDGDLEYWTAIQLLGGHMKPLIPFEIPIPADEGLRAEYLALGWYEVKGNDFFPARLKWSHAAGSPRHPGEPESPAVNWLLRSLEGGIIERVMSTLPDAADGPEFIDMPVLVTVRFQRQERKTKRKSAHRYYAWDAVDAGMVVDPKNPA